MKILIAIVWILAIIFAADTIYISFFTNFTAGTIMMWAITAFLFSYAVFHKEIAVFCRAGFGRFLKFGFLLGVAVFCGLFLFVAISGYTNSVQDDERVFVVLGAGIHGEQVGGILRRRLDASIEAHRRNPDALIVVCGGQGPQEAITEALAMQRYLIAHGIPESSILLEEKSTSTEENLVYAAEILMENGIETDVSIAVVTNAFHCYRAGRYAAMAGFSDVRYLPASMACSAILPAYMREVLAILFLWLFRR